MNRQAGDGTTRFQRRARVLLAALVLVLVAACFAGAQECTDCHDDVAVPAEPHGGLGCADCHDSIDVSSHPDDVDEKKAIQEPCGNCHDVAASLADSVHDGSDCADCHGPAHGIGLTDVSASPVSPRGQIESCGNCHDHDLIDRYKGGVHGRALLAAGLPVAASCASCHGVHEILAVADPESMVSPKHVPRTCGSCHTYLLETWTSESAHGLGWAKGNTEVPVCTTCHPAHGVERPTLAVSRLRFPEDCGNCHGEAYATYRDGFHGQFTSLGFMTAAICSDCHTPHRNLAPDDPRSSVHADNVVETCRECHADATAAFATFDAHADPTQPTRQPVVHYVWLFMTVLLVGVFGFFGVHDLLWLQRSAVAVWRDEIGAAHVGDGLWVRRFTRTDVWLHVIVVVSFLVLAASGLPLRFHDRAWGQMLADLLGGVGAMSLLHRWAALVTFGYFIFHVVQIARRFFQGEGFRIFWGPWSLVPQPRDLADLYRHVRYFLYLGPRPQFDRWTYWEKFDYLAVFWGVLIIGMSGLVLWFPSFFTQFLPGWALNVAFVVHSDEALLAVGFIFIFHFFHAHLRPESFPFDPVIFVDRMPLARFREERPLEYERVRSSGELDALLVDPPSEDQLRRAQVFGFSAVAIGMLLAGAILWTFIASLLAG